MKRTANTIIILGVICLIVISSLFFNALFMSKEGAKEDSFILVPEAEPKVEIKQYQKPKETEIRYAVKAPDYKPLDLELLATFVEIPVASLAVIKDKITGYEAMYKVRDRIRDATISHILLSKVILTRKDGKEEILKLTSKSVNTFVSLSDIITRSEGMTTVYKEALVSKYKNLNNILKEVSLRPAILEGRIQGIKIAKIKDESIIKEAGFKEKDIIKKINNRCSTSPKDAIRIYTDIIKQLTKTPELQLKVTLEREGRTETLSYHVVD